MCMGADSAVFADDDRAPQRARPNRLRPPPDGDRAGVPSQLVRLEQVLRPPRVLPPPLRSLDLYLSPLTKHHANGVGHFELTPRAGFYLLHGVEEGGTKHVDAD